MQFNNLHVLDSIERLVQQNKLGDALREATSLDFLPSNLRSTFAAISTRYQETRRSYLIGIYENEKYYIDLQAMALETELALAEARRRLIAPPGNIEKLGRPIAHFVGREKLLDDLQKKFSEGARIQVLTGMSGIGKSRIAIEYAYRAMKEGVYPTFVAWIDAHGQQIVSAQQKINKDQEEEQAANSIAERLIDLQWADLAAQIAPEDIRRFPADRQNGELLKWMGTVDHWLLIFDNAANAEIIQSYIPTTGKGHVLITSQNPTWEGTLDPAFVHEVSELDRFSSQQLLRQRSGGKMEPATEQKLLEDYGGYPFYLEASAAVSTQPFSSSSLFQLTEKKPESKRQSESDKREEYFSNVMFSVLGFGIDKPIRLKGEAQALLMIRMMSPRNIPIDFINDYIRYLLIYPEPKHVLLRVLTRPFLRFLRKQHDLHAVQRMDLLKKLAECSLIQDHRDGTFSMHQIVHDFFKYRIYLRPRIVSDNFLVGFILDFVTDKFHFSKNKIETIDRCRALLPHMLSMAEFCAHHYPKANYLGLLHKRILDFLEYEERYAPAVLVAAYALDLQALLKKPPSVDLVSQCVRIAISAGRFDFLQYLLDAFRSNLQPQQVAAAEGLIALIKSTSLEQRNESIKKLDQAAILDNSDLDFSEGVDLISALFLAETNPELSEQKFAFHEKVILEKKGEDSEDFAGFLTLKAKSYLLRSNHMDDPEELILQARDWAEQAMEILAELYSKPTMKYWEAVFTLAECERALGNYSALKNLISRFEENKTDIEEMFGPDHLSVANIYVNQAYLLSRWEGETDSARILMEKVVEIYRKFYHDQPEHPDLLAMVAVLEEIKLTLAEEE